MSDDTKDIVDRWAAATPGPWKIEREELGIHFSDEEQEVAFPASIGPIFRWEPHDRGRDDATQNEADAQAIAHAPADVARLVAKVEKMREQVRVLRTEPGLVGTACGERASKAEAEVERLTNAVALAVGIGQRRGVVVDAARVTCERIEELGAQDPDIFEGFELREALDDLDRTADSPSPAGAAMGEGLPVLTRESHAAIMEGLGRCPRCGRYLDGEADHLPEPPETCDCETGVGG